MQISYYMEIDSDRGKSSSKLNSHLGLMSIWNPIGGITFLAVFIIAISHSQALFFGLKKKKKKKSVAFWSTQTKLYKIRAFCMRWI